MLNSRVSVQHSNDCFIPQGKHANHTEHVPPEGFGECMPLHVFIHVDERNIVSLDHTFRIMSIS